MPGINLIIKPDKSLTLTVSTNPHACSLHYSMSSYAPLLDYCNHLVLPEWQSAIASLIEQERAIIQQRQQLMQSYKQELSKKLSTLIEDFHHSNPELFI